MKSVSCKILSHIHTRKIQSNKESERCCVIQKLPVKSSCYRSRKCYKFLFFGKDIIIRHYTRNRNCISFFAIIRILPLFHGFELVGWCVFFSFEISAVTWSFGQFSSLKLLLISHINKHEIRTFSWIQTQNRAHTEFEWSLFLNWHYRPKWGAKKNWPNH